MPTGAIIETNGLGTGAVGSGSINLSAAALGASQLCFNAPPVGNGVECPAGQTTVFPSGVAAACGDGNGADAGPCNIMAVDPNLTTPYITGWSIGVQHSFGSNLSLEVGYVGNHGSRLTGFRDINQINLQTGVKPFALLRMPQGDL